MRPPDAPGSPRNGPSRGGGTSRPEERRRRRTLRAIAEYEAKLAALDYRNYRREADYWMAATFYANRIRGLSKLLGGW